jgi:hypothetical protein
MERVEIPVKGLFFVKEARLGVDPIDKPPTRFGLRFAAPRPLGDIAVPREPVVGVGVRGRGVLRPGVLVLSRLRLRLGRGLRGNL